MGATAVGGSSLSNPDDTSLMVVGASSGLTIPRCLSGTTAYIGGQVLSPLSEWLVVGYGMPATLRLGYQSR